MTETHSYNNFFSSKKEKDFCHTIQQITWMGMGTFRKQFSGNQLKYMLGRGGDKL
jgi:hypothetical protein